MKLDKHESIPRFAAAWFDTLILWISCAQMWWHGQNIFIFLFLLKDFWQFFFFIDRIAVEFKY